MSLSKCTQNPHSACKLATLRDWHHCPPSVNNSSEDVSSDIRGAFASAEKCQHNEWENLTESRALENLHPDDEHTATRDMKFAFVLAHYSASMVSMCCSRRGCCYLLSTVDFSSCVSIDIRELKCSRVRLMMDGRVDASGWRGFAKFCGNPSSICPACRMDVIKLMENPSQLQTAAPSPSAS